MEMDKEESDDLFAEIEKDMIKGAVEDKKDAARTAAGVQGGSKGASSSGALNKVSVFSETTRQALMMANFESPDQAGCVVAAINEAYRYGCSIDPIMDWVAAHCGVSQKHQSRVEWIVQALTHLEDNQANPQKLNWRGKPKDEKPN